jgi:hypothetical protein
VYYTGNSEPDEFISNGVDVTVLLRLIRTYTELRLNDQISRNRLLYSDKTTVTLENIQQRNQIIFDAWMDILREIEKVTSNLPLDR